MERRPISQLRRKHTAAPILTIEKFDSENKFSKENEVNNVEIQIFEQNTWTPIVPQHATLQNSPIEELQSLPIKNNGTERVKEIDDLKDESTELPTRTTLPAKQQQQQQQQQDQHQQQHLEQQQQHQQLHLEQRANRLRQLNQDQATTIQPKVNIQEGQWIPLQSQQQEQQQQQQKQKQQQQQQQQNSHFRKRTLINPSVVVEIEETEGHSNVNNEQNDLFSIEQTTEAEVVETLKNIEAAKSTLFHQNEDKREQSH